MSRIVDVLAYYGFGAVFLACAAWVSISDLWRRYTAHAWWSSGSSSGS